MTPAEGEGEAFIAHRKLSPDRKSQSITKTSKKRQPSLAAIAPHKPPPPPPKHPPTSITNDSEKHPLAAKQTSISNVKNPIRPPPPPLATPKPIATQNSNQPVQLQDLTNPNLRPSFELAPGWVSVWSKSQKRWYFFNGKTNKSVWEWPPPV